MMSTPSKLQVTWTTREDPLIPVGVIARDEVAIELALKTLCLAPDELAKLNAIATDHELILLGDHNLLPWADGVCYVGRCPEVPALLMPTTLTCHPHPQLVFVCISREIEGVPILICPPLELIMSIAQASMIYPPALSAWVTHLKEHLHSSGLRQHESMK